MYSKPLVAVMRFTVFTKSDRINTGVEGSNPPPNIDIKW
jgi:hypothetical protein